MGHHISANRRQPDTFRSALDNQVSAVLLSEMLHVMPIAPEAAAGNGRGSRMEDSRSRAPIDLSPGKCEVSAVCDTVRRSTVDRSTCHPQCSRCAIYYVAVSLIVPDLTAGNGSGSIIDNTGSVIAVYIPACHVKSCKRNNSVPAIAADLRTRRTARNRKVCGRRNTMLSVVMDASVINRHRAAVCRDSARCVTVDLTRIHGKRPISI